jgi:hypothetical protein
VFVDTYYNGSEENIWYFSEEFIREVFMPDGYVICFSNRWHILSGLVYRITKDVNLSARFSSIDSILKYVPFLNKYCSNASFLIHKTNG